MKKLLFFAVSLLALSSCTYNGVVEEYSSDNQAIGFSTFADKSTKATVGPTALSDMYTQFGVFGFKAATVDQQIFGAGMAGGTPVEYFTADTVGQLVYTTAGTKPSDEWGTFSAGWFYQNVRYWDKLATGYKFFAFAPYEATPSPAYGALAQGSTAASIKIGSSSDMYDITSEKNLAFTGDSLVGKEELFAGFTKDYMSAYDFTTKSGICTFSFHHLLTKFNVKVFKSAFYLGAQEIKVKDVQIVGLAEEGYYAFTTDYSTNGWTCGSDTARALKVTKDFSLTDTLQNYDSCYWIQTLILPQAINCRDSLVRASAATFQTYVYVNYSIGEELYSSYFDLAKIFDSSLEAGDTFDFKQGCDYTLNITIGPEPIIFAAECSAWDDQSDASITF